MLHKGRTIDGPRAENATHHILMGIDLDLDRALRKAVLATVDFLVEEHGLSRSQAFSLASIAVDFRVAEAVDLTQVVTAFVPKAIFLEHVATAGGIAESDATELAVPGRILRDFT